MVCGVFLGLASRVNREYPCPKYRAAGRDRCIVTIDSSSLVTRRELQFTHAAGQIGEEKAGLMSSRKGVICGQQYGTKDRRDFPYILRPATSEIAALKYSPRRRLCVEVGIYQSVEHVSYLRLSVVAC